MAHTPPTLQTVPTLDNRGTFVDFPYNSPRMSVHTAVGSLSRSSRYLSIVACPVGGDSSSVYHTVHLFSSGLHSVLSKLFDDVGLVLC